MTAVGWDPDGWDDDEQPAAPASAVPDYLCEGPCCRPTGLLARIRGALHHLVTGR